MNGIGCASRATWTWPTLSTWKPRWLPTHSADCLLGSTESVEVRSSIAVGNLARGQVTLELDGGNCREPRQRRKREVVLHVHLEHATVLGAGGSRLAPGDPEDRSSRSSSGSWCANADTRITVRPVLDLAEHLHVNTYKPPPG